MYDCSIDVYVARTCWLGFDIEVKGHTAVSLVSRVKTCCLVFHLLMALCLVTWLLALKEPAGVNMLCIEEFLCASKSYLSEYDTPWTFVWKKCQLCCISFPWSLCLDFLDYILKPCQVDFRVYFHSCLYTKHFCHWNSFFVFVFKKQNLCQLFIRSNSLLTNNVLLSPSVTS